MGQHHDVGVLSCADAVLFPSTIVARIIESTALVAPDRVVLNDDGVELHRGEAVLVASESLLPKSQEEVRFKAREEILEQFGG